MGHVELSGAIPELAEVRDVSAVLRVFLNAVVHRVDHVQEVFAVDGQSRRPVELSLAAAMLAPPAEVLAVGGEARNAVRGAVGDVEFSLLDIELDRHRPHEAGVGDAFLIRLPAEAAEVVVLDVRNEDGARLALRVHAALADDVQPTVSCRGHVGREVHPHEFADRLEVWESGSQKSVWSHVRPPC